MKPTCPTSPNKRRFPVTDYFFQSGVDRWRGFSSYGGDDDSESRRFHNFSREFLLESARERAKEMVVFAIVVAAAAWPVICMVIMVVKLLSKGHVLGH